jgi:hypothetical protein
MQRSAACCDADVPVARLRGHQTPIELRVLTTSGHPETRHHEKLVLEVTEMSGQAQTRTFHPTIDNRALLTAIALAAGVIVAGLVAVAVMNAPARTGVQTDAARSVISTDVVLGPGYTEWRRAQAAALSSTDVVLGPGYTEWRRAQAAALSSTSEVPGPGYTEWRRSQHAGQ